MQITGHSMERVFRNGSHVLVDLRAQPPADLVGQPVVAYLSHDEGITTRELREDETNQYWLLVPANKDYGVRSLAKTRADFQVFRSWRRFRARIECNLSLRETEVRRELIGN